ADRRPEVLRRSRLRAAPEDRHRHGDEGARDDQGPVAMQARSDDLGLRVGTGLFGAVILAVVGGIGYILLTDSYDSIAKFAWQFWLTDIWDPVSGEFCARPFIWATMYSSLLAILLAGPVALGIAIYISELSPGVLQRPLMFLTELLAAIPSIVYGLWGIFVLVPFVRSLETSMPQAVR